MLFQYDDYLVDIVRETPYKNVYTVRSSSHRALRDFRVATSSQMVRVPHHLYPFIIHIDENSSPLRVPYPLANSMEVMERLTPEPACFIFEYCYEQEDGEYVGEYGYCWPQEVESTTEYLMTGEREIVGEPTFLPLFKIPSELVSAPFKIPEGDFDKGERNQADGTESED